MNNVSYSIVVPVYGTADSLREMALRVKRVFEDQIKDSYELIFVNDCSPNKMTAPVLDEIVNQDACVRVITLSRNFGQQATTLGGIANASGDYIITMDDDLQHWPEEIPKLIEQKNHDIVIAKLTQNKHGFTKRVFSAIKGYFDHILIGKPKHISMSSFRLFNRLLADGVLSVKSLYPFLPALLFMVSKDVVNVEVAHHERYDGETTYTFRKMLAMFSNLMINNSSYLLGMIGKVGLTSAFGSFLLAIYFIGKKLIFNSTIVGWTSIIVILLFLGGMILLGIGIIGEYLIRIVNTVELQPTYIIREKKGFE